MKILKFLSIAFIAIALLVSCEKKKTDEFDISTQDLRDAAKMIITENLTSLPLSTEGITPYLIPGSNNGGNRTCEEVAEAFSTEFDMCGDKIDYEEGSFMGSFPYGLTVETDGTLVSFSMDDCFEIDGGFYKVGAVIVKGSDEANVYWYPNGSTGDSELAAPINSSGGTAGLSNLSFCFVECPPQETVIVLKSYVKDYGYIYSSGSLDYAPNCITNKLGYNDVTESFYISMVNSDSEVSANVFIENGSTTVDITIDLIDDDLSLLHTYVYLGALSGLETFYCPDWSSWSKYELPAGNIHTFSMY